MRRKESQARGTDEPRMWEPKDYSGKTFAGCNYSGEIEQLLRDVKLGCKEPADPCPTDLKHRKGFASNSLEREHC